MHLVRTYCTHLYPNAITRHRTVPPIRSLAYFLPVIDEVIAMRVSPDYFQYVRRKLERIAHDR